MTRYEGTTAEYLLELFDHVGQDELAALFVEGDPWYDGARVRYRFDSPAALRLALAEPCPEAAGCP